MRKTEHNVAKKPISERPGKEVYDPVRNQAYPGVQRGACTHGVVRVLDGGRPIRFIHILWSVAPGKEVGDPVRTERAHPLVHVEHAPRVWLEHRTEEG
jgi:hypothetical protein